MILTTPENKGVCEMSKTNKKKERIRGEYKSKKYMYKTKKDWIVASATIAIGISAFGMTSSAEAWQATTVAEMGTRVKAEDGQYTFQNGDTFWAIGNAINIKPEKLMEWNNFAQGTQYSVPIGTVIHWDGNHVTITDSNGNVVADKVISDMDKVNSSQPVAGQATDTPKNPVLADTNGNVTTNQNNNSQVANKPSGNGNISKPNSPQNPEMPEVKKYAVTVVYKDMDGNILGKDADVQVEENKEFTATAKIFDNFTLVGQSTQTVKVTADTILTFTYKANEQTPPTPIEKYNVTINYVDTEGNELAPKDVVEVEKGKEYTAYATTMADYTLQGSGTQTVLVDSDKEVTFVYEKNVIPLEKYAVTVQYIDTDGNVLATDTPILVENGQVFTANAKDFDGFTLQGDTTQTVTVDENQTISFTYKKDAPKLYTIIVQYVDTDGNVLKTEPTVKMTAGMKYTVTADAIDGYTLVGEPSQSITVSKDETMTFVYKKDEEASSTQEVLK